MRRSLLLLAIICIALITIFPKDGLGWGSPAAKDVTMAGICSILAGLQVDYTWGGGHVSPDDRRTAYEGDEYTSGEGEGVDCSGLWLVATAVADYEKPNATAHQICTTSSQTTAVSPADTDFRVGDSIGIDDDSNGTFEHMGIVVAVDPGNNQIDVVHASGSGDEVVTVEDVVVSGPGKNTFWCDWENNVHRRTATSP